MSSAGILQGKHAVIFGAGATIGAAVAKQFVAEGAEVFLSGRTKSKVDAVAREISSAEGRAHSAVVDALDVSAVDQYLDAVAKQAGTIDVVFNTVGPRESEYGAGKHTLDLSIDEMMTPLLKFAKSEFITASAAARRMVKQKSGVIIFLTASTVRGHVTGGTAIGAAFGAIEAYMENLAYDIGPSGVRSVCLRITANTDSRSIQDIMEKGAAAQNVTKDQMVAWIANMNFLKVPMSVNDTAKAAAFLASDYARMFTGTRVNSSAAAALD